MVAIDGQLLQRKNSANRRPERELSMVKSRFYPDRGDVVWISLSSQAGHEGAGHRPALILSPTSYNGRVSLAILCPITSRVKGYPFEVEVPGGCELEGVILADQVKNLDWRQRDAEFIRNHS